MNDIERELTRENREKKRVAASASKRVGLRKGCKFPYEMLSGAERKKYMQASEVTVFTLRPMTMKEFKECPGDKKVELLKWYGEKYGWNAAGVAAALGVGYAKGAKLLDEFMLSGMFKARMKACTNEQKAQFMANRKELEQRRQNEAKAAPREDQTTTQDETENQTMDAMCDQTSGLQIVLIGDKLGSQIERQLEGIANSLESDVRYIVKLSIVELASNEYEGVSNVEQA